MNYLSIFADLALRRVVYFNQRLGAARSKCWLKYAFLMFLTSTSYKKEKKAKKFAAKFYKKTLFLKFAPKRWSKFFQLFSFKNVKNHILTSVWRAQHPNAGRNIQQKGLCIHPYDNEPLSQVLKQVVNLSCSSK